MKLIQSLLLAATVLSTSACANNAVRHQPEAASFVAQATPEFSLNDSTENSLTLVTFSTKALAPPAALSRISGAPGAAAANQDESTEADADDGYSMLVNDPWEGYNRAMYKFNSKVDKYIVRPVGVAYDTVVPDVVQPHVTSVFSNLQEPRTMVNQLLQGRLIGAAKTLGRFVVNTTVGVAGVFDPASKLELHRANEDLGQTLAVWGWDNSRFFVAPLQGPKTVRDFISGFGDSPLNPAGYIDDKGVSMALTIVKIGSMRANALPMEKMRAEALDEYSFVRDAWIQKRNHQIKEH